MASFVPSDSAIYSASVLESATVFGFFDPHSIAVPANKKAYPVHDLLSSMQLAQSASMNPSGLVVNKLIS